MQISDGGFSKYFFNTKQEEKRTLFSLKPVAKVWQTFKVGPVLLVDA